MKLCVIQPEYSADFSRADELFEKQLSLMEHCDSSMDIIVMPEACDIPVVAKTKEQSEELYHKYNKILLEKAAETAKRCNSILFLNARSETPNGIRNTTYAFNRKGQIVGKYYKQHLVPNEVSILKLDSDYTFEFSEPTVIEIEGIRFAFLVCYDFYFYEAFANIARQNVDVIIGCSHQRSDTHRSIRIISQFLAYNTNAYVVRSSVSMDEKSDIGGGSMIVAPNGEILADMESRIGIETAEIDVNNKYYKPAGFGNAPSAHYEYIEKGRRPWKYRPAGSAIVLPDSRMPYPRVCAYNGMCKEVLGNSMAALGAAIGAGTDEIAFEIYKNEVGVMVAESEMILFEEILKKFSCHTVMNIIVRDDLNAETVKDIFSLIKKYDCEKYIYFTVCDTENAKILKTNNENISICFDIRDKNSYDAIENALLLGIQKIILSGSCCVPEIINKVHENKIICIACADEVTEACEYINNGIDTVLTNSCHKILQIIKEIREENA